MTRFRMEPDRDQPIFQWGAHVLDANRDIPTKKLHRALREAETRPFAMRIYPYI